MSKGGISLLVFVLVFLVFAQVAGHQLVDWDDSFVISENPVLAPDLSGAARARAILAPHHGNWIPLTQLSLLLTRALAGPEPDGFLIGNFLLHALSAVLLFLALARMTGALGRSAFVAAVFAVHPLRLYREGLRLRPTHPAGQASLGRVLLHLGRPLEARIALERAQALGIDSAALYGLLATSAQLLGRDADAVREYRMALARDPELISAANNLAWILAASRDASLRDPGEAVRRAETALAKREVPDAGFLDTLAVSYAADGRFEDAVRTATSAAELADRTGQTSTAREIRGRIPLFRAHRAWVDPALEDHR